jgi:hypothetical protein
MANGQISLPHGWAIKKSGALVLALPGGGGERSCNGTVRFGGSSSML